MPRVVLALCVLAVAGGCPGVLAPSMDPVRWRCEAVSSPDPRVRDDALAYLEHEFVEEHWTKYKFVTDAHRAELAACLPRLARLLDDPDPAVRRRARRTLGGMSPHVHTIQAPGTQEVIQAVVRDLDRLWQARDLPPEEARDRPTLLVLSLIHI